MGFFLISRLVHPLGRNIACQLQDNDSYLFWIIDFFEDILSAIDSHFSPGIKKHILAAFCIQFQGVHRTFEADQIMDPRHSLDNLSEVRLAI